jgi:tRNA(fMet)-specific endonuclease VapC
MRCIDTNVVIAALNGRPAEVRDRLTVALAGGDPVALSSIVLFELRYGIARSRYPERNEQALERLLSLDLTMLSFEPEDAAVAGTIRADLERAGTPIGHDDLLIAGQALRHGAVLVTANRREFLRVPGLTIESWSV